MWTVKSEIVDCVPVYYVEHTETHERKRGCFDTERIAAAFAEYLNKKDTNPE